MVKIFNDGSENFFSSIPDHDQTNFRGPLRHNKVLKPGEGGTLVATNGQTFVELTPRIIDSKKPDAK